MSDATLYHQALVEYREGKASPELLSKAYVLAGDSVNPKAQEIEYVKLRVKELGGTSTKRIAERASTLIDDTRAKASQAYAELQSSNQRIKKITEITDTEDAAAASGRDFSIGRGTYAILMFCTATLFGIVFGSVEKTAESGTIVMLAIVDCCVVALIVLARLRNIGDNGIWALTALIPFNFVVVIYCLLVRPNGSLSRRQAVIDGFRGDATDDDALKAFLDGLPKAPERTPLSGLASFFAICSVVIFVAFIFILLNGLNRINSSYSVGVSSHQSPPTSPSSKLLDSRSQLSQEQAAENQAYNAVVDQLEARVPRVNPKNASYDAALVQAIETAEQANERRGDRPTTALKNAITSIVGDIWTPQTVQSRSQEAQPNEAIRSKCEIKDVMTDEDMAACRAATLK